MLQKKDTGKVETIVGQSATPSAQKIVDVLNPLNAMSEVAGLIVTQVSEIDNIFVKIEDTISSLSMTFGGMRNFAQSIRENILDATTGVMSLGGELEDVVNIQKGVIKGLQTQTILTKDSFEGLYASGALLNDGNKATAESTQKLASEFVNAGYSIYDVSKQVVGIVNESRAQGVIISAVYSQISANMNRLALYNFENGVQGMAQMAAKAASLRIDMKGALDVAEKLFDPKNAIELAADMQRLGVNVASLLDPYKLMDMKNDPVKLQEEIIKATESLTYFNEINDRVEILPEAQLTIRELAKSLGYSNEEFAKMAINAGELQIKLREIKFSADFEGDEETKNLIANMAQRKDNKYVITFDEYNKQTGNIESVTKEVSQLTKDNKEALLKAAEPAKSAVELQRSANLTLTNIALDIHAIRGLGGRGFVRSAGFATLVDKAGKFAQPRYQAAAETLGINKIRNKSGEITTDVTIFNQGVSKLGDITVNFVKDIAKGQMDFQKLLKLSETYINSITDKVLKFPEKYQGILNKIEAGKTTNLLEPNEVPKNSSEQKPPTSKVNNVTNKPILNNLPQNVKDKITAQQIFQTQTDIQNQNQGTVKEFKSTIDINIKVDPTDLNATVMNYFNQYGVVKLLSKEIENYHRNNDTLRGVTTRGVTT